MCQTYPRPRCSAHTSSALESELKVLKELMEEAGGYKRVPSLLADKIARQENRVALAQRQHNCTKRGREELKEKLKNLSPSRDRLLYSHYQRSLDQAEVDATNHRLAAHVYDAYKDKLDPAEDTGVIRAKQKRNAISAQIAYVSNQSDNPSAPVGTLERQYETFVREENKASTRFLLKQRGITRPVVTRNPPKSGEAYVYLPAREFGHLASEFPQGCYAQVKGITETPEGNLAGMLEGVKPLILPRTTAFIINKPS